MQQQDRERETSQIIRLDQTAITLDRLVQYLRAANETKSDALAQIVLSNHPAFRRLAKVMGITFRAFFETREELDNLLETFGYTEDIFSSDSGFSFWKRVIEPKSKIASLKVKDDLFAKDGRIQPQGSINWNDDWISKEVREIADEYAQSAEISDDDIPF